MYRNFVDFNLKILPNLIWKFCVFVLPAAESPVRNFVLNRNSVLLLPKSYSQADPQLIWNFGNKGYLFANLAWKGKQKNFGKCWNFRSLKTKR